MDTKNDRMMKKDAYVDARTRVIQILRTKKNEKREMPDLRHQLHQVEKERRLIQAGASGARATGERGEKSEHAFACMDALYDVQHTRVMKRIAHLRENERMYEYLLSALDDMQERVIHLRWVEGRTWNAIAHRIYMSDRTCQRVQKAAIERMTKLLEQADHPCSILTSNMT